MLQRRHPLPAILLLLLILVAALPTGTASAEPAEQIPGLTILVEPGYDDYYKLGEWFPVQVMLSNDGAGFSGRLEIDAYDLNQQVVSTYAVDVDLPAPSRKQVTLYSYSASFQRDFTLRLRIDNNVAFQMPVKLTPVEEPAFIYGVVADDPALLNALSGEDFGYIGVGPQMPYGSTTSTTSSASATIAHLALEEIPDVALGLNGLDALLFASIDTSRLTPDQVEAIRGWVGRGGALVVAGGPNGSATSAGLSSLLPVQVGSSTQLDRFPGLASYVTADSVSTPFGAAQVSNLTLLPETGAQVLAAEGDTPLLVRRSLGGGQVFFLALDPALAPLKTWDGLASFWQAVFVAQRVELSPGAWRRMQVYYSYYYGDNYGTPFDIPSLDLPSVLVVGGFLLAYIFVIGPLNFIILRRLKKPELAWVTIPALIILFAVGAYAFGRQSRGTTLFVAEGTVVRTYPNSDIASLDGFVGLFSPDRRDYDVQFEDGVAITEINASGLGLPESGGNKATIVGGGPTRLDDLSLDTWSLRGFLAEGTITYPEPFQASIQLDGNRLTGTLTNSAPSELRDVILFSGDNLQRIDRLAPGETTQVDLQLDSSGLLIDVIRQMFPALPQNVYDQAQTPEERRAMRQASLVSMALFDDDENSTEDLGVGVIGWAQDSPLPVQVAGENPQRDDLNLVYSTLPVELASGDISLPAALIKRRVLNGSVDTATGTGQMIIGLGFATFGWTMPAGVTVNEMTLHYDADIYSSPEVDAAIFNWETGDWEILGDGNDPLFNNQSASGDLVIEDPAPYVGPTNEVQIKLGDEEMYYASIYLNQLDLSAEVTR